MQEGLIYKGKAKTIWKTENPTHIVMKFEDSITAGDGAKKANIEGKGKTNCKISTLIFKFLTEAGIPTHYIETLDATRILTTHVDIIPLEVICRNIATGSFTRRYGFEEGKPLSIPLLEYFLKEDSLHDPYDKGCMQN